MGDYDKELRQMADAPQNVRFLDLYKICEHFFGEPRRKGTSHCVFQTPWPRGPRVNIQNDNGNAKAYQVRQVLTALRRLKEFNNGCE